MDNNIFTTKSEYVYKTLKEKILNNVIKPGESLVIARISKEYNVSSIPVREALKDLEKEGLVEIEPHKTAKVSTFNIDKLREIGTVRAGLEGYAARLAVDFITDEKLDALLVFIEDMRKSVNLENKETFIKKNIEFHRYLYQVQPYTMLFDMIINVWESSKWTRAIFSIRPERMEESLCEHEAIIDALKNKDRDQVERLVREHRNRASKELEEMLKTDDSI